MNAQHFELPALGGRQASPGVGRGSHRQLLTTLAQHTPSFLNQPASPVRHVHPGELPGLQLIVSLPQGLRGASYST
ncbi:MAG: hypothetical protein PVG14_10285 [Anaerolineales bacterium]